MALKLFISYSRIDSSVANTLYADLQARGFEPWIDTQRLEGGDNFTRYIQAAINASDVLLLLLTPSAVASQWVELEYTYAKNQGKRIIPLKMGADLPLVLTTTNFIDFEHGYERGREQLLLAITTPDRRPTDPLNYDELYQEAVRAMTKRDYERADAVLKRIPTDFRGGTVAQIRQEMQSDLRRQRIINFRAQADAARQAGELDRYAGALEALLQEDPQNKEARRELLEHYRFIGDYSYTHGAYQDAFVTWAALLKLEPSDPKAQEYLPVAKDNAMATPFYSDARKFIQQDNLPAARTALTQVWNLAPYYGDPEGLAGRLELSVPQSFENFLHEKNEKEEKVRQIKAEEAKKKRKVEEEQRRAEVEQRIREAEEAKKEQKRLKIRKRLILTSKILGVASGIVAGLGALYLFIFDSLPFLPEAWGFYIFIFLVIYFVIFLIIIWLVSRFSRYGNYS